MGGAQGPLAAGDPATRLRVRVRGAVQGVGFRPFAYGLARRLSLTGFVQNDAEGVLLEIEGARARDFLDTLAKEPPPLARVACVDVEPVPAKHDADFSIRDSGTGRARTRMVADAATCDACLADLFDPKSRFYRYPFVTCTHCGPRLTLTRGLPYDRARTSMAGFPLCDACAADYHDPDSRRFHAEPIACPACGPRLSHPVADIAAAIRAGRIVALKGIGGFHLVCDAMNGASVAELRRRKGRDAKPFALMVANAASAGHVALPEPAELDLAASSARPIVLMRAGPHLPAAVAPGLSRVGVMLAYAPLHHLLFAELSGRPAAGYDPAAPVAAALVATSANPGGEPLVIDDADAVRRLAGIADLIVTHDRAIVVRADDSLAAVVDGAPALLRRARGFVPEPVDLGREGPSVIAAGAHLKATLTITRGREAFVSQHVGDLDDVETLRFYHETARHLAAILDVEPELAACDLHPDFRSTRFAEALDLPLVRVQHHAAHVAAVAAEHGIDGPLLGVALDGHGYGSDGGAWGGELLLLDGDGFARLGHLAPLPLPGGDRAAREPWRMGLAALAALGRLDEAAVRFADVPAAAPLAALLGRGGRLPTTTSLGRLFDAVASLLRVAREQSYEGQAAMQLEALVGTPQAWPGGFRLEGGVLDVRPLLGVLCDRAPTPREGADLFHGTLAAGLGAWIVEAARRLRLGRVALGGGCVMNRVLVEDLCARLRSEGIEPLLPRLVPANDGGLSLGQAHMALAAHAAAAGRAGMDLPEAGPCA